MVNLSKLAQAWKVNHAKCQSNGHPIVVPSPRPVFEEAFADVATKCKQVLQRSGLAWVDALARASSLNGELVDQLMSLSDEIDNDIYGQYCKGTLTSSAFLDYCAKVGVWRTLSLQVLSLIETKLDVGQERMGQENLDRDI